MLTGWRAWAWLAVLCAALYLPGIAAMPAIDRDESRFMQASRQMVETGDIIRIRFHDRSRNKKPVGIYWMQAASVAVVSTADSTERWPYRIPSVLGALAAVWLMFLLAQLFVDRRTAFLAAALLASCLLLVVEANIAKTDAVLLATIMLAQLGLARAWFRSREGRPPDWASPVMLWAGLGLGALVKGPIGPLTLALTLIALKIFGPRVRLWPHLKPLIGVPLALAVIAPWYIAIISIDPTFLQESAGRDLMGKVFGAQEKHGFPPGFYIAALGGTFAPASLLVWLSLVWSFRYRREPKVVFALAWLLPYWLLLEILPTKLPHYVLPLYPALVLLVVMAVEAAETGTLRFARWWLTRAWFLIWLSLVVGAAAACLWLPWATDGRFVWPVLVSVIGGLIVGGLVVRLAWQTRFRAALLLAACAAPFYFAPILQWGLPAADWIWPSRTAERMVAASGGSAKTVVGSSGYTEPSFIFHNGTDTIYAEPAALATALPANRDWRAFVRAGGTAAFEAAMQKRGLRFRKLGTLRGFNYTRGRMLVMTLYGPSR